MASFELDRFREALLKHIETRKDAHGPVDCYRRVPGGRPDLYASVDVILTWQIMGVDIHEQLTSEQRQAWTSHLNSYASSEFLEPRDGSYTDRLGHSKLHANGQLIGALGVLGGRKVDRCRLYDPFDTAEKIAAYLEYEVKWVDPWSQSHKFWGGLHCFSRFTRRCPPGWLDACFDWLDRHVDPRTGWWCKGVPAAEPHSYLGGAVHILPIYEHHHRTFEHLPQAIDQTLKLQLDTHSWHPTSNPGSDWPLTYLDLDALYMYHLASLMCPDHRRGDIEASVCRFGDVAIRALTDGWDRLTGMHMHHLLAAAGTMGLLSRLDPDRFVTQHRWSDIFSDLALYRVDEVEPL